MLDWKKHKLESRLPGEISMLRRQYDPGWNNIKLGGRSRELKPRLWHFVAM